MWDSAGTLAHLSPPLAEATQLYVHMQALGEWPLQYYQTYIPHAKWKPVVQVEGLLCPLLTVNYS